MSRLYSPLKWIFWPSLSALAGCLMVCASAYLYLSPNLPDVTTLRDFELQTPLRVYTADKKLMGEFGEKKRSPLHYDEIPQPFIKALLAAEDDRFFQHNGVNLLGIARAITELVLTGEKGSGGSTITMQVARAVFLNKDRVFIRKFNEIIIALEMEMALSKEEILEMYVNEVFLGHRAYGFEAAAQVYYGKGLAELDIAQWAMLAGLPKAPSAYNPIVNPPRALLRRNWILDRMALLGYINTSQHQQAKATPITASKHGAPLELYAPYAAEMVRSELMERFGDEIYTAGYTVHTTLNSELQKRAEQAVRRGLLAYDSRHGYRGPERRLLEDPEAELDVADITQLLRSMATMGGQIPAVVTQIYDDNLEFILGDGSTHILPWENGLSNARPYVSVNQRGSKPATIREFLQRGDLIRVTNMAEDDTDEAWHLGQVPAAQAALISLKTNSGAIQAIIGGFDYSQSKFNRVTQANRQPGSNLKPFIYAAAIENGFSAASVFNDAPVVFKDKALEATWRPENDSGRFAGPTRLREALYSSRNLVSIRLLQRLGISKAIDYLSRFGFDPTTLPNNLSLALGTVAATPMQVARGYASFSNGGFLIDPYLIEQVETFSDGVIFTADPALACDDDCLAQFQQPTLDAEQRAALELNRALGLAPASNDTDETLQQTNLAPRVMDKRVNYIMTDILGDTIKKGTGRRARALNRKDLAGKTGTTNGPTDVWFSGFNRQIVTSTWLGFDDNRELGAREFGSNAALPMWIDYMRLALADSPESMRKRPNGIVSVRIDPETGELASASQSNAIFEIFREENAPSSSRPGNPKTNDDSDTTPVLEEIF